MLHVAMQKSFMAALSRGLEVELPRKHEEDVVENGKNKVVAFS